MFGQIKVEKTRETLKLFKVSWGLYAVNRSDPIQQKLLRVAHDLYMSLGIRSVSMDDVAREMGISKKTLYQLVENKEELVLRVMEEDGRCDMEQLNRNLNDSKDAIDEFVRNSRYFIRQMRQISPTTLRDLQKYYRHIWESQTKRHQLEFSQSVARNIERGMEEGLYRNDLHPQIIANFFAGSVMMMIDTNVFPATERPLADIIHQHAMYHFNGIVNAFGRERIEQYLKTESLE